jgi:poly(3-hydroxybutyrate) depolymerase
MFVLFVPSGAFANTESFWGAKEFYTHKTHERYLLLFPPHYNPNRNYELWVNLHGSPGCASHAIYQYRDAAQQREVLLLAPQANGWSALPYERPDGTKDHYRAWDMKKDRARVMEALDEVVSTYPIRKDRIALLGFSAGCEMGWRLLSERPTSFYFFGGVANGFRKGKPPISEAALRNAAPHVAHFYAAGKADPFAGPMYKGTVRRLKSDGFELRTVLAAGVGHDLPPSIKMPLLTFLDEVRRRHIDIQVSQKPRVIQKTSARSHWRVLTLIYVNIGAILLMVMASWRLRNLRVHRI